MIITQPKYFKDAFHFDIARVGHATRRYVYSIDSINDKRCRPTFLLAALVSVAGST